MAYNVETKTQDVSSLLTKQDLAIAAYALAEVFNSYLEAYEAEDFGDMTKDSMELTMGKIRDSFSKFNAIIESTGVTKGDNSDS